MTAEHPILYTADSVRAYLEDRKTQTRRVIKPQPWLMDKVYFRLFRKDYGGRKCPYGQVGDRLWVRETWATYGVMNRWKPSDLPCNEFIAFRATHKYPHQYKWRPSIFMPRWASRLTQTITEVRVERLQDISKADCKAEGINLANSMAIVSDFWLQDYRNAYKKLWDSLNTKRGYAWNTDAWVWVISYPKYSEEPTRTGNVKTNTT